MSSPLLSRKIKVETPLRCDFDHMPIERGKYATQVVGDPQEVKAQGIYHGRLCYEGALANYQEKKDELDLQEEANG